MSAHVVLGLYAQVRRGHILDRARSADIPACDLYPVAPGDRARANEPRSALSHRHRPVRGECGIPREVRRPRS